MLHELAKVRFHQCAPNSSTDLLSGCISVKLAPDWAKRVDFRVANKQIEQLEIRQ